MAKALSERADEADRLVLARTFCSQFITAWWRSLTRSEAPEPPLRAPLQLLDDGDLPPSAKALADSLGETAGRLGAETAAYHIGLTYTCMLPRAHRAELGIYYTPPAIAERLISQATAGGVNWARCRVLDPACGGGAFLAPVARRILEELPDCSPRILVENIANRLRGFEIDSFAAWLSQVALDAVLLPVTQAAGRRLPVVIRVCDSLREEPPGDLFDLVIGNPPYGRVRLAPADRARFKRSLYGHANLYGLFTDVALRHTRSGGVIAYVTPTSFLAGEYFKNLRVLLASHAPPVSFDFVSVRRGVFDSVLQETLLATYKRGGRETLVSVHEIAPLGESAPLVEEAGSFPLPREPSLPWILPRCAQQVPLVSVLSGMKHRLGDWGYAVSTGPLVWNRYRDQLATASGPGRYPLIWAEAVRSDGRFMWRADKRNHTLWFQIGGGDDWLKTSRHCVLVQRTTAKEQSRRLVAAALPTSFLETHGAIVVENHLNMLRPLADRDAVPADVLAAFLNSASADAAFRCVSGSVAVSAYELEALPLPSPEALEPFRRLVRQEADRSRLDLECARLYGRAS